MTGHDRGLPRVATNSRRNDIRGPCANVTEDLGNWGTAANQMPRSGGTPRGKQTLS
jgi:hypothetical protein